MDLLALVLHDYYNGKEMNFLPEITATLLSALMAFMSSLHPFPQTPTVQEKIAPVVQAETKEMTKEDTKRNSDLPTPIQEKLLTKNTYSYKVTPKAGTTSTPAPSEKVSGKGTAMSTPSPTKTQPTKKPSSTVRAESSIHMDGRSINLTMLYPQNGGAISGTITGDCTGTISGTYAGPATGELKGSADAKCPAKFLKIPVKITYTGKLAAGDTKAVIDYSASAMGKIFEDRTIIMLHED